jgi:PTS system mannose-specific IIB component
MWSKYLGVDRILVLNNEAAENDLIKKSLLMAAPQDVKVAIETIENGINMLNDPRSESLKILIVVKTPQDILKIINSVKGIPKVNIGNFGRAAPSEGTLTRKTFRTNLYMYDSEVLVIKKILDSGIECVFQIIPDDKPEPMKKIIN